MYPPARPPEARNKVVPWPEEGITLPLDAVSRGTVDNARLYGFTLMQHNITHPEPGQPGEELTLAAQYVVTPRMTAGATLARFDLRDNLEHTRIRDYYNINGEKVRDPSTGGLAAVTPREFECHLAELHALLSAAGMADRARVAEYLACATQWDTVRERRVSTADVLAVMWLPLTIFDRLMVLAHGADRIPQMTAVVGVPASYLLDLFNIPELRLQHLSYRAAYKRGHLGE